MLRAEVYAHAMRASQNRKKEVRFNSNFRNAKFLGNFFINRVAENILLEKKGKEGKRMKKKGRRSEKEGGRAGRGVDSRWVPSVVYYIRVDIARY